jgi:hypothetical protein
MSVGSELQASLDRLSLLVRQQVLFRLTVLGATVGFLVLLSAAGADYHPFLSAVALLLAVLVMIVPDSSASLFLVVGLGGLWAIATPATLSGWVLVAALDLLVLHLAVTLASYGPPALALDPLLLAIWVRRGAVLGAVAALTWLGARLLSGLHLPSSGWAFGLALGVLLGWLALVTPRMVDRD